MIKIGKYGDKLSPEDKDVEDKYYITSNIARANEYGVAIYLDFNDIKDVYIQLGHLIKEEEERELEELRSSGHRPEDIKF